MDQPAPPSLLSKLSAGVAQHSGLALAAIVVLVLTVAYLYARLRGWLGGSAEKSEQMAPAKKRSEVRAAGADAGSTLATEGDAEIDALIEAVASA